MGQLTADRPSPPRVDQALLLLRLTLGGVFIFYGVSKFFPWGDTVGFFEGVGAPMPAVSATFNMVLEIVAGLMMVLGVAVPWAVVLIVLDVLLILTPVNIVIGVHHDWWVAATWRIGVALAIGMAGPGHLRLQSRFLRSMPGA